ncbi:hypothetical protein ACKWTF_010931 [Chironomus riparius]
MGGKMLKKLSMSLLLITFIIACSKSEEAPEDPKKEKAIAEAKVDFTDGIEMQIKKVTSADGKEISILIKKEVLPDSMAPNSDAPKRKRRDVADNVLDLEKLKNDNNYKLEKIKDAEGNEIEVYVLDVLEQENQRK